MNYKGNHNTDEVYIGKRKLIGSFSWGYIGTGPSNLAKAILKDFAERGEVVDAHAFSEEVFSYFRDEFLAKLSRDHDWIITDDNIADWARSMQHMTKVLNREGVTTFVLY